MTGFDFSAIRNSEDKEVWVEYSDQINVLIRHIPRERLAGILKQATKTVWGKDHQPEHTIDNIKYGELIGDMAIVAWEGFVENGQPVPCTSENKRLLMRTWSNFAKFVSDISSDLDRLIELEKEAARKNSSTTSGEPSTTPG